MDQSMNFTQNIDALFSNLEDFTRNESVLGKPLVHEGKTLIPIISVTVGYGSGNTPQKNQQTNTGTAAAAMQGTALGLGARVTTEAVVLIENNNVQMLPVNSKGATMMDKLPQVLSNITGQGQNQNQNQNQNQGQNQNQ